jgi:hypothetical protein
VAEKKGLVQRLKVAVGSPTYVAVGPSPTNNIVFFIERAAGDTAPEAMVAALASAMVARWEVVLIYDDNSVNVTGVRIESPV